VTEIQIRGWTYERIRYVPRGEWEGGVYRHRCPGCGIWPTNFHHVGCEIEMCPACEGRLAVCRCEYGYRPSALSRFL
jgi:hypothetical protein